MRKPLVAAAAAGFALVLADAAFAHAIVSPPVAKTKVLQQFTLSVPTEEEGATTTTIELTLPSGFSIDSFEPEPGWKRTEQATGSGEEKTIQKVTWSGGSVPTDEDSVFRFNGSLDSSKTYTFKVRQTYSNGKIVDWTGSESSDTPAPVVDGVSDLGGGSSSTLTIVALVVGAHRRVARNPRPGDEGTAARVRRSACSPLAAAAALALPAVAWAHAGLVRTVPSASKTVNAPPSQVAAQLHRAGRATVSRSSPSPTRQGRQITSGPPRNAPGAPQTLITPLRRAPEGWYLVFWRVISADGHPVRGAFTFAVGPNPGPPPQFRCRP